MHVELSSLPHLSSRNSDRQFSDGEGKNVNFSCQMGENVAIPNFLLVATFYTPLCSPE
jgi:hypothetical protein